MMMLTTAPIGLLLLAGFCLSDEGFGYDEHDGPSTWGNQWQTCNGDRQSPININETEVQEKEDMLQLQLYGKSKRQLMSIENNGHTIMLKSKESVDKRPEVIGGPLGTDPYKFEQLHFHWGKNNYEGSETTINRKSYAMEMHAVFYKKEYGSINDAVNYPDGLAVLGYMFEVPKFLMQYTCNQNNAMQRIVNALSEVIKPNNEQKEIKNFQLFDLIDINGLKYYTYNGSLTTPPCLEVVTWFIFPRTKCITNKQLNAFRQVQQADGSKMTHNFRPPQPLNGRVVYTPGKQRSGQCDKKLPPLPWLMMLQTLGFYWSSTI